MSQWHASYLHGGIEALLPQWEPLPEVTWALVEQRYVLLGELAEAETFSQEMLDTLASGQGWTLRQAERWLTRYRVKGMMGLAPAKRSPKTNILPDLGALTEVQCNELFRRHALLGKLAEQKHVPNALLQKQADAEGVSLRTLRDYHTRFQRHGLVGLAPRSRTDKGTPHLLSSETTQFIESLRLTHRDASVRQIYELACQYAAKKGERPPGLWQVRSISQQIPAPIRLLSDERESEFRNRYLLTYPIAHDAHRIIWQIDHKAPLHMLVRDLRSPSHRTLLGEVRPYLTLVIDRIHDHEGGTYFCTRSLRRKPPS